MIRTAKTPAAMSSKRQCANAAIRSKEDWDAVHWDYHAMIVKKLQLRIAKATRLKKFRKVRHLQWILTHSFSAKLLAVRDVLQNSGSKTPGVDGITIKAPAEKLALAKSLRRRHYKPSPLRRIYIPKAGNKKKLRPISIPTIYDRAFQSLYTQALLPVSEVTADPNSYGFRPQRSCADAIAHCFNMLAKRGSPKYILEADISGCFDHISHEWLRKHICMDKMILDKWLKAGYVDMNKLFPTTAGTPQGGICSPVLCNETLDGIDKMLKSNFSHQRGIHYIRYADDFIVTAHSKELLEQEIKPAIETFLKVRGLELSREKTKVTHIEKGFDFLGQNLRKYPDHGRLKLLIKPSKKNIYTFLEGIRKVFRGACSLTQPQLIRILNPKIRGWANYHRCVVSKATFNRIDKILWDLTFKWARRRHPQKGKRWILQKYFKRVKGVNHRFAGIEIQKDGTTQEFTLLKMAYTPIRRHVKIQGSAHPFDTKYDEYFERRTSDKWRNNSKRMTVENKISMIQKNTCPNCNKRLTINQRWCISLKRKASIGGEYKLGNMDIVHSGCYEQWQHEKSVKKQAV